MTIRKKPGLGTTSKDNRIFILEVCIVDGPTPKKFVKKKKAICRTIQIRGNQTLEDLHDTIFDAFDREEEHMYEFQIGGKGPTDPEARKYVLPMMLEESFFEKPAGTIDAAIGSLGLKQDDAFGYLFDFGDDWWHKVNVMGIEEKAGPGKYPKITNRVGESPLQYVDWEEDD